MPPAPDLGLAAMRSWTALLTSATALGAAASGGAFLTYSGFTTTALRHLPPDRAVAAMQQVNLAAPRSATFMTVLFAPAVAGAVAAVHAVLARQSGAGWVVAGAAVYAVGVVGVTVAFHVPRNDLLAAWDPVADAGRWDGWVRAWVAGNHVRTVCGLASAALFLRSLASGT